MSDKHRAGIKKAREVAEKLGSPGQYATPEQRDANDRDPLPRSADASSKMTTHQSPTVTRARQACRLDLISAG